MTHLPFNIVVAIDQNQGIGKDGALSWHLPGDLKHFKTLTTTTGSPQKQNVVIMGRKTWESIPEKFRPLPQRLNVVITRQKDIDFPDGVLKASSLDHALDLLNQAAFNKTIENIFVIGGSEIFKTAVNHPSCDKLYITHIVHVFACDKFFPPFSPSFRLQSKSPMLEEKAIPYYFSVYMHM